MLSVLVTLALLAGVGGGWSAPAPAPTAAVARSSLVTVPSFVGLRASAAGCLAARRHLRLRSGDGPVRRTTPLRTCDGTVHVAPDPRVLRQRPRAGTRVRRGTVVHLEDECTRLPPGQGCA